MCGQFPNVPAEKPGKITFRLHAVDEHEEHDNDDRDELQTDTPAHELLTQVGALVARKVYETSDEDHEHGRIPLELSPIGGKSYLDFRVPKSFRANENAGEDAP
jgi:hypothetical protein